MRKKAEFDFELLTKTGLFEFVEIDGKRAIRLSPNYKAKRKELGISKDDFDNYGNKNG